MSWEEFQEALEKHVEGYCEFVISKNLEEMGVI
jgi:predicted house-cleaning noncanonical NTP pyrophosphatase (MazG superfamily)